MSNNVNVIESPVGKVIFSVLHTPRKSNNPNKADVLEYSTTMEFDESAPGVKEFKATLEGINDSLVVTKVKSGSKAPAIAPGHFRVTARSKNRPIIFDKDGVTLGKDEVPMIAQATATILITTFEGKNGLGGGLNLQGVQLLTVTEYEGSSAVDEDTLRAKLSKKA